VFEFANFTFRIKCPIFVARQWMRHRMGSYVEKSLRYTKAENFYIPEGTDAKQLFDAAIRTSISAYETLLAIGVKKEQARAVLPLSVMTEFYWNVNARSLMNFLKLRLDKHAQLEIREYAQEIMNIFESKMPITAKYFKEMI
jgi:thymidylate synthase (FAD)